MADSTRYTMTADDLRLMRQREEIGKYNSVAIWFALMTIVQLIITVCTDGTDAPTAAVITSGALTGAWALLSTYWMAKSVRESTYLTDELREAERWTRRWAQENEG